MLRREPVHRKKATWPFDRERFRKAPESYRRRATLSASDSAPRWRPSRRGPGHIFDKRAGSLLRAGHARYRDRYPAARRALLR